MNRNLLDKAIEFAVIHHAGQTRDGGEPYILHPLRVMFAVSEVYEDYNTMMAAVLHDTVEDTDATIIDIVKFGKRVTRLVNLLTKKKDEKYADYLSQIKPDLDAKIIKLADIADNSNLDKIKHVSNPVGMLKRYARANAFLKGMTSKF